MTTQPLRLITVEKTPQWSPLVVSGMTWVHDGDGNIHWGPQWSPLVVSGMTWWVPPGGDTGAQAAMEPARGERDDQTSHGTHYRWMRAAMEPARGERDDVRAGQAAAGAGAGRNGARSW